ncbi:hypothetical protein SAMN05421504_1011460 [Amycolatopsis xylanica]|uniref:Uncharacterized protein n=1 Tax=Amycolatopsis xylanica TaxID=589385 RepID=A0A1H2W9Q2_9PSEU|nr:hypothetical protein [Amycolatopsis xylanica]SDW77014.1 hypothetical protein SAMN05421504_1011460 [Amycolatopsis xylanica]
MHRKRVPGLLAVAVLLAGCASAPPPARAESVVYDLGDAVFSGRGKPSRVTTGWLDRFGVAEATVPVKSSAGNAAVTVSTAARWGVVSVLAG